ncbi:MAG: hypothetical protein K2X81_11470 [Candidatus Obscuribacterales bacterium]|nr:hypothetical protein [Candidatus Obscuribacterales bacterium]
MSHSQNLDDDDFANAWLFSQSDSIQSVEKKPNIVQQNIEAIRAYAYEAFDKLDTNGNGFIETSELYDALEDDNVPMREKSYIMFLLNHQEEISDCEDEGVPEMVDGISRMDLEQYFRIILNRL